MIFTLLAEESLTPGTALYTDLHKEIERPTVQQAEDWVRAKRWKLAQWKNEPEWTFMYLCLVVQVGEQKTIDGRTVFNHSPIGAWSGTRAMPKFKTEKLARAWADNANFKYEG